jgi:coenzyme F420-reducing hydrogenase delta subunit
VFKRLLPVLGIDPRRFEYTWVSASEGPRWQKVVTDFTAQIHDLGPANFFADSPELDFLKAGVFTRQ